MKKRIISYMEYIDNALQNNTTGYTYGELMEEHKTQIGFFMHERLIHLIATLVFFFLAFASFFFMYMQFSPEILVIFVTMLVLIMPFAFNYYVLETGLQKMYRQYDELHKRKKIPFDS